MRRSCTSVGGASSLYWLMMALANSGCSEIQRGMVAFAGALVGAGEKPPGRAGESLAQASGSRGKQPTIVESSMIDYL